jgi:hypothetical protein
MPEESVFTKELLADGRIVGYFFVSTGSEAADEWQNELITQFSNWDSSKPLLLLVDLCGANNLVSAEMMRTALEASKARPDISGKTAVVVDSHEPSQNAKAMVDRVMAEPRVRKMFDNQEDAIAWLLEP